MAAKLCWFYRRRHDAGRLLRISQYVYFALSSQSVSAAEVTAHLGIEPDEITVRGARRTTPTPVPVEHSWQVHCPDHTLRLDDQTQAVLDRLTAIHDRLVELVHSCDVRASLSFVRYLDDDEGEEENLDDTVTEDGQIFHRIAGQHQLLGWTLSPEQLAFLVSVNAGIDADEYG